MNRRLYRCRHDQRLAGVASGVAEFFDLDPTLVRVLFFLSIFLGGFGLLVYIGLALIVPLEPLADGTTPDAAADVVAADASTIAHEPHRHAARGGGVGQLATFAGLVLILIGALALVDAFLPAWSDSGRYLWPVFLIGIGALLVARAIRRAPSEP